MSKKKRKRKNGSTWGNLDIRFNSDAAKAGREIDSIGKKVKGLSVSMSEAVNAVKGAWDDPTPEVMAQGLFDIYSPDFKKRKKK